MGGKLFQEYRFLAEFCGKLGQLCKNVREFALVHTLG